MSHRISFLHHLLFFLAIARPSFADVLIPMAYSYMIQMVCRNNSNPAACINVLLTSDPKSKTCDLAGLARISLEHAKTAAKETSDYIRRLNARTTDPTLHAMFDECSDRYNHATGYVVEAIEDLNAGAYSPMIGKSVAIAQSAMMCETTFNEAPSRPSPLTDRNNLIYCLGQIGSAVGDMLLYPLPPSR